MVKNSSKNQENDDDNKLSAVAKSSLVVAGEHRVARFRGRPMLMTYEGFPHFVPLHRERFDQIAYPVLGGISRGKMGDIFAYLSNTAEDLTGNDRYVLFGVPGGDAVPVIWDMQKLEITISVSPDAAIWRCPYAALGSKVAGEREPVPFILSLAGGNLEVYDDIMQSLAPMIMLKKPDGVIWWVGDGANGKSTLMDAIYRMFPGQLSSITVKRLTDGRDTPSLNGTLANVVKESSEGRIDDTEIYKSIGTHEDFRVHKFHSQDDVTITGNVHHIFSANQIPAFNDKGFSARRRTFIVPFNERFESDPNFEAKTFTDEMFGRLIMEMMVYAGRIARQGYRYKWSAITLAAKNEYDTDANNAEEYAKEIIAEGVVGFDSFTPVRQDYDNWCADNGFVTLGLGNLRRALQALGFERLTYRGDNGKTGKNYRLPGFAESDLQKLSMSRPGLYTVAGFQAEVKETEPLVPEFQEPVKDSVLKGNW